MVYSVIPLFVNHSSQGWLLHGLKIVAEKHYEQHLLRVERSLLDVDS